MAISIEQAKALVIEFCAEYPVASKISYKLRNTQEEALDEPKATIEREGRIYGAYFPGRGYAAFAVSNFRDEDDFKGTLRHEILGHFGINTFDPGAKRAVLTALIEARNQPGLDKLWAHVDRNYPGTDDMRKAEEVFAFACEDIDPGNRSAAVYGNQSFDEVCLARSRVMRVTDLINLTTMVAEGLHDKTRSQQTFPATDSAQFKQDSPMNTSGYPVWLAVQPDDRDKLRAAAGLLSDGRAAVVWDKEEKLWMARPGCDLDRIQQWLPDRSIRAGGGDPESEFLDVLTQAGLIVKGMPVMNGQRQRVATTDDKNGKKSGVYCGYLDRRPAGWFVNYHHAESAKDVTNWTSTGGQADPMARVHIRAAAKQSQEDAMRERAEMHARETLAAKTLYDRLPAADPAHPYLVRKGIPPTPDIRQTRNGALVVPFFSADGNFKTLQYIPETGDKLLFKDAPKQGNFLVVGGPLEPGQPILYAEGYATARSLNLALDRPVVMTIDAGNMVTVAQILHQQFPGTVHVFLADFDHAKKENKGLIMATEAAAQVGGQVLYPTFTEAEIAQGFTDFNDLHQSRGLDAVRDQAAHLFVRHDEVPTMQDKTTPETTPVVVTPQIQAPDLNEMASDTMAGNVQSVPAYAQQIEAAGINHSVPSQDLPAAPDVSPEPAMALSVGPEVQTAKDDLDRVSQPVEAGSTPTPSRSEDVAAVSAVDAASALVAPVAEAAEPAHEPAPAVESVIPQPEPVTIVERPAAEKVAQEAPRDMLEEPADGAAVAPQATAAAEPETSPVAPAEDLAALMPRRPAPAESKATETVMDAINVGPRIGKDEPQQQSSSIDKDALLTRITHEPQNDNSVLYKLDNEPAFVDRGSRLEMVPGSGQSDEKIVAALLTAARFYRGQIELTGSDAFKAKAIELIALHQVNVSMKNPAQQLMLDQARQALGAPAVKPDAILGDTPPPFDPAPAAPVNPDHGSATAQQLAVQVPQPAQSSSPGWESDLAHSTYAPFDAQVSAQSMPVLDDAPPLGAPVDPQVVSPAAPTAHKVPQGDVSPAVHQTAKEAAKGVTGKIISCGPAPFRFEAENSESIHIKLRTKAGTQTFWGRELAGLLRDTRIAPGRMVTLQWLGEQPVTVRAPVKAEGVVVGWENKQTKRNQWSMSLLDGPTVRTGDDQGVKLTAYDALRFGMIQNSVLAQLGLQIESPKPPSDGLFWITPNGQGSAKAGDDLSAPRPDVDSSAAGKPVMSSWSADGQLEMALFRGDGPYLQGVVLQGNAYQHVLVSLPGHSEAPAMVFNAITEQGLVPIGLGNGINRSGGEPVAREHIAFKLEGDSATRIGKLDFPADLPPALHHRLGFNERWKDTNNLPKSAPAAAPTAQPSAARPS